MNLLAVPPSLAPQAWARASEFIEAACDRVDLLEPKFIEQEVMDGKAILWLAADGLKVMGAGVTQLFVQRGKKVCEVMVWGSCDQKRCTPLLRTTIEQFARNEGCHVVRLGGRKGWARHLTDYSVKALILEKAL